MMVIVLHDNDEIINIQSIENENYRMIPKKVFYIHISTLTFVFLN